jgi:hypothetical protein
MAAGARTCEYDVGAEILVRTLAPLALATRLRRVDSDELPSLQPELRVVMHHTRRKFVP